ncbi:hypothetical protein RFI_38203, partial [Reticulomyxa filosa]
MASTKSDYNNDPSENYRRNVGRIRWDHNENENVPALEHMNTDQDDFHLPNQRRPSIDLSSPYYGKQKRQRPDDDDDKENDQMQRTKKIRMNSDIGLQVSLSLNNSDERKEELNDKNIWKKSRKIRREYFCNKLPTL